jgi:HEAT repeat protein
MDTIDQLIAQIAEHRDTDHAIEQLAAAGEAAVEPLLGALEGPRDRESAEDYQAALARIGRPAVEPLVKALQQDRASDLVTWTLGQIGDPRSVEPLIQALNHRNLYVRWAAAHSLQRLADTRAIEPLIERLRDRSAFVKKPVIEALGAIGDSRAIKPLKRLLESRDTKLRSAAAEAIAKIENRLPFR